MGLGANKDDSIRQEVKYLQRQKNDNNHGFLDSSKLARR